jgi:hypothetical protein
VILVGATIRRRLLASVSLAAAMTVGLPAPTLAAPPAGGHTPAPPPSDSPDSDEQEIVVNGQRPPGAVVGDIPPELQYSPADIRAYGVSSVSDLLAELAPEIQSDRGRGGEAPAVLLNGRRISSFSEIRDIPTEAILRVDILPEEVALKYGFSADQRVVNIVLRRRFHSLTGQADGATSTEGGGDTGVGDFNMFRIRGDNRVNLDVKYQAADDLTESQRGIMSAATGRPYALAGNVGPAPGAGGIVDPALSAAARMPVTVAGVPASAAAGTPSLSDFVPGANVPNTTDISPYRTLAPATHEFTINSVIARPIFNRLTATVNGTFDITNSASLRGLPGATLLVPSTDPFSPFGQGVALYRYLDTQALTQDVQTITGHLGVSVNGDFAKWRLSFTANADASNARTVTQSGIDVSAVQDALDGGDPTLNPFAPLPASRLGNMLTSRARATAESGNVQMVANGPLFDLPAGPLTSSIKAGWSDSGFDASSTRGGVTQSVSLPRSNANGQLSLDLPIASRTHHVLSAIGNLSANVNLAVSQLSDFGTLTTLGYGLNWTPRDGINLIASTTHDHAAPTVQQLGNPVVVTPDVRVFDYRTGQTVDVTETAGGNRSLQADSRHVEKLGLTLKPIHGTDLTLTANYIHSTIRNAIAGFPSPTAAIEAAFPDRFTRDGDGNLESIDVRPINFAREDRQELRWGINFTRKLKTSRQLLDAYRALRQQAGANFFRRREGGGAGPGGQSGGGGTGGALAANGDGSGTAGTPPPGGAPAANGDGDGSRPGNSGGGGNGGGGRGGFGGRGGGGGGQGGRLQISFYHTWYFRDDILVKQGGPRLDLLNGGTTGSGGGQPQHVVTLQAGVTNNGIGIRMNGQWQSATTVTGGTGTVTGNLHFSALATANLRLFADLGQLPPLVKHRWARGMRVTLSVTNLLDSRQHVRDATGATPLNYQPAYLDPMGRTIRLSVRKLLF